MHVHPPSPTHASVPFSCAAARSATEIRREPIPTTDSTPPTLTLTSQERILKRIHELYEKGLNPGSDGSVGLLSIAADPLLQMKIYKPRKKVNVMLIGNHSAGKSSFINWYIGESVQTTGVAIETRGFTFVTSGRKRDTLKGDATFAFYDHLDGSVR